MEQVEQNNKNEQDKQVIAALDLGSNSFHITLVKVEHGEIRPLEILGEKVQLAADLSDDRILSNAAIARALDCLQRFAQLVTKLAPGTIRIVGTQVLRKARNRYQLIWQARQLLGHDIEVISGHEEARLIYLGVSHRLPQSDETRLVIDIGGGSTELIIGKNFEAHALESISLGCVSLTKRYFEDGIITSTKYASAYTAARLKLLDIENRFTPNRWQTAIGTSGSARTIAAVCDANGFGKNEITAAGIKWQKKHLLKIGDINNLDLKEIKESRRSIYPAGLAIMEAIFDALEIESMQYCDWALREGVIYDLLGRSQQEDVRTRTLNAMIERCAVDVEHANQISNTALESLAKVAQFWQLNEPWHQEVLFWAAQIHEVGRAISHNKYHKHGAYLIKHADLAGFSHQEQHMLALLVRYQKRKIKLEAFAKFDMLNESLLKLCILLRLAIILNNCRTKNEPFSIKFKPIENGLSLHFIDDYLSHNQLTAAKLMQEANFLQKIDFNLQFR